MILIVIVCGDASHELRQPIRSLIVVVSHIVVGVICIIVVMIIIIVVMHHDIQMTVLENNFHIMTAADDG